MDPLNAPTLPYRPLRASVSHVVPVRGWRYHVRVWGQVHTSTPERPPLVLVHGWMDVAASWQFMVDALSAGRCVIAPDWRGFGLSTTDHTVQGYWFPDYLADLDALLRSPELGLAPDQAVDLVGHSMGGNIVMMYAAARPERIRKLVNIEGFGMPDRRPDEAPGQFRKWLNEQLEPVQLRDYPSVEAVARRLRLNNPRLGEDRAQWLAGHWAAPDAHGRWHILGDPAHKRMNPVLYRQAEIEACWRAIAAPVLWVEGQDTDVFKWWTGRYSRADFDARLAVLKQVQTVLYPDCGHMVHHDQPQALAAHLEAFLDT